MHTSFFFSHLIQRWVVDITERLVMNPDLLHEMNLQPLMDSLTLELLTLSEFLMNNYK